MTMSVYILVPATLFLGLILVTTILGGMGVDIVAQRRTNAK
jgi:hypothetical protein